MACFITDGLETALFVYKFQHSYTNTAPGTKKTTPKTLVWKNNFKKKNNPNPGKCLQTELAKATNRTALATSRDAKSFSVFFQQHSSGFAFFDCKEPRKVQHAAQTEQENGWNV